MPNSDKKEQLLGGKPPETTTERKIETKEDNEEA